MDEDPVLNVLVFIVVACAVMLCLLYARHQGWCGSCGESHRGLSERAAQEYYDARVVGEDEDVAMQLALRMSLEEQREAERRAQRPPEALLSDASGSLAAVGDTIVMAPYMGPERDAVAASGRTDTAASTSSGGGGGGSSASSGAGGTANESDGRTGREATSAADEHAVHIAGADAGSPADADEAPLRASSDDAAHLTHPVLEASRSTDSEFAREAAVGQDVVDWLASMQPDMSAHAPALVADGWSSLELAARLREADLVTIGVPRGHARAIVAAAAKLAPLDKDAAAGVDLMDESVASAFRAQEEELALAGTYMQSEYSAGSDEHDHEGGEQDEDDDGSWERVEAADAEPVGDIDSDVGSGSAHDSASEDGHAEVADVDPGTFGDDEVVVDVAHPQAVDASSTEAAPVAARDGVDGAPSP